MKCWYSTRHFHVRLPDKILAHLFDMNPSNLTCYVCQIVKNL
jgi:hypothetical protein